MFTVVTVAANAPVRQEQLGTKFKFWYADPNLGWCLFKQARPNTGEDWAERITDYLCELLEIPHANYELATWQETPDVNRLGVVSPAILKDSEQLILGNQLLGDILTDYGATRNKRGGNQQHTVDNVLSRLAGYPPPPASLPAVFANAAEVFVGYLMLDALIGNADRHDENWACIADSNGTNARLAPTYDHASSLGRELNDERRQEMLTTKDRPRTVEGYCASAKIRSALYEHEKDKTALSMTAAFDLAAKQFPMAAKVWLERLSHVNSGTFEEGFRKIPNDRISDLGIRCGVRILSYNQGVLIGE